MGATWAKRRGYYFRFFFAYADSPLPGLALVKYQRQVPRKIADQIRVLAGQAGDVADMPYFVALAAQVFTLEHFKIRLQILRFYVVSCRPPGVVLGQDLIFNKFAYRWCVRSSEPSPLVSQLLLRFRSRVKIKWRNK